MWEKIVKWFGYKIHLLADTNYELPISYKVTRASKHDSPVLEKLLKKTEDKHPRIIKNAEELTADRGYDSEENNKLLWDEYKIKPLIDIRDMWKDEKGQTRPLHPDIARSSYAWRREYKRRTAVERINSRMDLSFGFEHHFIRGLAKMEVKIGLAMVVMLGMALGSIKAKQNTLMRSLVKARPRTRPKVRDPVLTAVA